MDAYEATRIVFSRIQNIDPENASKIMGFLLIQDHGDKEMIRLAFGPETLIHSLIIKAYNELGLSSNPPSPSPSPSPFFPLSRQNSSSRLPFNSNSSAASYASVVATNGNDNNAFNRAKNNHTEFIDELHLQDQLAFLNDASPKNPDLFYPSSELATSPSDSATDGMLFNSYSPNWGVNNEQHRRSLSVTDIGLGGSDPFGWKPCLYYARGYCKNGTSCRFLHAPPDSPDSTTNVGSPGKLDIMEQCQELLLRSKSQQHYHHQQQRLSNASHLLASASFPYSAAKCPNFLMQQQQNDTRAAAAAGLMLGGEDLHQYGRSRIDKNDFASITAGMVNPASRQIYLTFPADSTFREEDVSNYFSIYGPVQDVRIPYQQKRMFGFVTFVYPETVKLILAKGNPHFVCDARVLVKPYKEKGKIPDRKQQQQLVERSDFPPSTTLSGHDNRDPYDLQVMQMQSSPRLLYNTNELLLRRKLEEQAELQQAIELQSRKLMGLHLFDGNKHHRRNLSTGTAPIHVPIHSHAFANQNFFIPPGQSSPKMPLDDCASSASSLALSTIADQNSKKQAELDCGDNRKENSKHCDHTVEHNLPESPFASPTKTMVMPLVCLSFLPQRLSKASVVPWHHHLLATIIT
ncbi:hypothetical protein IFM89_004497 [Coptis chinensis]|uniref:Uncharacterized protein n=1 Tax=Coptis chinensis TaxID=261450 RepID=A0A835LAX4_9MAGN|nr:hypothetical protein IFM89_004497 [Coptis chinensis]